MPTKKVTASTPPLREEGAGKKSFFVTYDEGNICGLYPVLQKEKADSDTEDESVKTKMTVHCCIGTGKLVHS